MSIQSDLLTEIEAFIATHKIAETTFGRLVVNDGQMLRRLRAEENMTLKTLDRVRAYLDAHAVPANQAAE
jgi:hypothetical protein